MGENFDCDEVYTYPLNSLPLGESLFHALRADEQIYVDKTELIFKLLTQSKKNYLFLSRPRRFGKSLLVSTLYSLFSHGLEDFKGLAIEKLWHEGTYPVIHLDFSSCINFETIDDFRELFLRTLKDAVEAAGIDFPKRDDDDPDLIAARFKRFFMRGLSSKIVLLVDEYDTPLNHCLHKNSLFKQVSSELNSFYAVVKQYSGVFRCIFITGICKYKNLGLFSGTNFIKDISLYSKYANLLGYTEDEIKQYFAGYIQRAAHYLGLSFDECMHELTRHYDGYCFDENATIRVHNPWSVLSFMDEPERGFRNYWYDSAGRPSVLENYLKCHALRDPREYGQDQFISSDNLDSSQDVLTLNDLTLLMQAGYLTIKDVDPNGSLFTLNYPNLEVAQSMSKLYVENLFGSSVESVVGASSLAVFLKYSIPEIVLKLNLAFTRLNYRSFPISNEYALQRDIQLYLAGGGVAVDVEKHNAYGRSDLEFKVGKRYFVLELKLCRENQEPEIKLKEAISQIKDRHYGAGVDLKEDPLELICLALVFSEKSRQFVEFEQVRVAGYC